MPERGVIRGMEQRVIFYHGTTKAIAKKILQSELRARFYEPEWFTLADETQLYLAENHAKMRGDKNGSVIKVSIPKSLKKEFVYREGGLKKPIPAKYLSVVI